MKTLSRRHFLTMAGTCLAASAVTLQVPGLAFAAEPFPMPPLPYAMDALAPVISEKTISFHYGKHTAGYYTRTNKAVSEKGWKGMSLEKVILAARDKDPKLFNNAAQAWNHTFYWEQFTPSGVFSAKGQGYGGRAAEAINAAFDGFGAFKKAFVNAAGGQFGSGWAWLVDKGGKLDIVTTANAELPLGTGATPLLVVDVWEHAYYLDYQNRRKDHVAGVLDKLVNWDVIAARM